MRFNGSNLAHLALGCAAALCCAPALAMAPNGTTISSNQTVTGGSYTGSDAFAPDIFGGAGAEVNGTGTTVVITGGTFTGGSGAPGQAAVVGTGGPGGPGGDALYVDGTGDMVSVYGGIYNPGPGGPGGLGSPTGTDGPPGFAFDISSTDNTVTLYGTFAGGPQTILGTDNAGTVTGSLETNGGPPVTYDYYLATGSTLILANSGPVPAAVPEPASTMSLLVLGSLLAALVGGRRCLRTAPRLS